MRAAACALALGLSLALGGCVLSEDEADPVRGASKEGNAERGGFEPRKGEPAEARAIRAWIAALNDEDFDKAASYFNEDAVVEQPPGRRRLEGREDAVAFNRSLPCKAEVTDVDDEGDTVLAAFRLRGGPGGGCDGGSARVRFRFEDGKFAEWRQLAEPASPEGDIARSANDV